MVPPMAGSSSSSVPGWTALPLVPSDSTASPVPSAASSAPDWPGSAAIWSVPGFS